MGLRNERLRWQLASGFLRRVHLQRLAERYDHRTVMAGFNFVNGGLSIALVSFLALMTQEAFIFPSLGATAFILFYVPMAEPASPRNTFCGHLAGALSGLGAIYLFGLQNEPSAMLAGVDLARVGAAALSLGVTSGLMVLLRIAHPPAGATALIVSLGLMPHIQQLPVLMAGVSLLVIQAFVVNRLAGIPYPLWRSGADPQATVLTRPT
ncbi:HPP family protein [Hydrocarboniclastica marina]|uniref:HPP family protein n=1 Tax=Hydrocarboniclastica marina TaxID=2259620 RepID=A0A4P7XJL4_9ALTE|nr:HPP family protein [Hydrocarboniclastica marina]QCF26744.1 HPP family protein [Hydrocarboniclastica marina]